jgi:release factor glutamine methyltransferase
VSASDTHHAGVGRRSDASVRDALGGAIDALAAAGVETPRLDAEILLCEATGWDRAVPAADPGRGVPAAAGRRFGEMVRRRLRREPVAYILGRKGFRHIELAVDRRVLIPRPETEMLVELALELRPRRLLDVGTGSGAIALAVADELPECEVTATDTSATALEVARANAERLGLAARVRFLEGTVPGDGTVEDEEGFDLVVANLPYVSEAEWGGLQPEVTRWEPREALLAGPDGLDAIRAFLPECVRRLSRIPRQTTNAPTTFALEVGLGQAEAVAAMLRDAGLGAVEARRDLAGIERVVLGRMAR